ncbi:MAG TPA: acetyl-CoA carboxylase biotin carboxyl carrier protein subunit [Anaerovoracaceae bacterium]|nr:acetyl-CoA carboxylase biotin carboxyl carrier protein subunit [Anaerovoracaceae bacterium]
MANKITAPLPGLIWDVLVEVGQKVEINEPLLVLEAMKMQNEIFSDYAGVVKSIPVNKGDNVNTGDVLIEVE